MLCGDKFLKCGENVTRSVVIGYEGALHKIKFSILGCIYSKPQVTSNIRKKLTDYRYRQRAWTGNHVIVFLLLKLRV